MEVRMVPEACPEKGAEASVTDANRQRWKACSQSTNVILDAGCACYQCVPGMWSFGISKMYS
eukprot:6213135-Pleurochrysis_carterae.AAC.1